MAPESYDIESVELKSLEAGIVKIMMILDHCSCIPIIQHIHLTPL